MVAPTSEDAEGDGVDKCHTHTFSFSLTHALSHFGAQSGTGSKPSDLGCRPETDEESGSGAGSEGGKAFSNSVCRRGIGRWNGGGTKEAG